MYACTKQPINMLAYFQLTERYLNEEEEEELQQLEKNKHSFHIHILVEVKVIFCLKTVKVQTTQLHLNLSSQCVHESYCLNQICINSKHFPI